MKTRIAVVILMVAFLVGCAGQMGIVADLVVEEGFYSVLKNNPQYIDETLSALKAIKVFTGGEAVSYDELLVCADLKLPVRDRTAKKIKELVTASLAGSEPVLNSARLLEWTGTKEEILSKIDGLIQAAEDAKADTNT